jgi:copper chaperone NosL
MARYSVTSRPALCAALFVGSMAMGCAQPGPGVIHYDSDACDHCRMTISDPGFAAQLVTRTGKVYRFDDPACLVSFAAAGRVAPADVHSIWVNDHAHPDKLISAQDALFIVSYRIRAPMNGGMAAFGSGNEAASLQSAVGGELRTWAEVRTRVAP